MSKVDLELEHFKLVVDHYKQDVREYWTKANFFFLANTALLSGYIVYLNQQTYLLLAIILPLAGMIVAGFFYLILETSHFWTKVWRCEVLRLCKETQRFYCYEQVENIGQKKPYMHPEFWTQLLDVAFVFVWAGFLMLNFPFVVYNKLPSVSVLILGFVVAAILFFEKEKKPIKEICDSNLKPPDGMLHHQPF
jgi:uncharacterized membrane-anchored protein